jgi:hypothetical protein
VFSEQKKPAHPSDKSPEWLALKLSFSFPPPKNVLRSAGLASDYAGSLFNDGGGLRTHKYHTEKGCQEARFRLRIQLIAAVQLGLSEAELKDCKRRLSEQFQSLSLSVSTSAPRSAAISRNCSRAPSRSSTISWARTSARGDYRIPRGSRLRARRYRAAFIEKIVQKAKPNPRNPPQGLIRSLRKVASWETETANRGSRRPCDLGTPRRDLALAWSSAA